MGWFSPAASLASASHPDYHRRVLFVSGPISALPQRGSGTGDFITCACGQAANWFSVLHRSNDISGVLVAFKFTDGRLGYMLPLIESATGGLITSHYQGKRRREGGGAPFDVLKPNKYLLFLSFFSVHTRQEFSRSTATRPSSVPWFQAKNSSAAKPLLQSVRTRSW